MAPTSDGHFSQLIANLNQIRTSGPGRWSVSAEEPLRTSESCEYEKDGKASYPIFGEVSWTWNIAPDRPRKKSQLPESFEVNGIASALVRIRRADDRSAVAEWTAEFGAVDSPGCYFHGHVNNVVCIPRLPSLFVTPMDTLEFLLGELFQNRWPEHASSERHDVIFWRSRQSKLLARVLDWKRQKIESTVGSPWVALKRAKPEESDNLFVEAR
ncbi:MAG: hypothetical protein HYV60_18915 [Planctomycetia bacterium]|nr:hypothetical protein [Planctomycetia bacterium]